MANVCCSIEMEPKTLNEGQLHHAREVAVDIVQKMEPKAASNVFAEVCVCNSLTASLQTRASNNSLVVQGLREVVALKEMEQMVEKVEADELSEDSETSPAIGVPCQCSCSPTNLESPEQAALRAPLSAPF